LAGIGAMAYHGWVCLKTNRVMIYAHWRRPLLLPPVGSVTVYFKRVLNMLLWMCTARRQAWTLVERRLRKWVHEIKRKPILQKPVRCPLLG
jgi:hypothetical protein